MITLPIVKKLKKKIHRDVALLQDILVMEIYNHYSSAVIHGGTALWRCYGGNRFSGDVNVYLPLSMKNSNFENFLDGMKEKGFTIDKFKQTNNSIFAKFSSLSATVRFEVLFKNVKNFVTKHFEMSDGNFILVNTLSPEDMIKEKISAYLDRKKIRDIYDIFYLLKFVENRSEIRNELKKLVNNFVKPSDEKELKTLIISGSIPNIKKMLEVIKKWAK